MEPVRSVLCVGGGTIRQIAGATGDLEESRQPASTSIFEECLSDVCTLQEHNQPPPVSSMNAFLTYAHYTNTLSLKSNQHCCLPWFSSSSRLVSHPTLLLNALSTLNTVSQENAQIASSRCLILKGKRRQRANSVAVKHCSVNIGNVKMCRCGH